MEIFLLRAVSANVVERSEERTFLAERVWSLETHYSHRRKLRRFLIEFDG